MSASMKRMGKATAGCCGGCCSGFKEFILRGNVVDLAVAVVIGAAFTELVNAFVDAFITPLIGMIGDPSATSKLSFTILGSEFNYGVFITALISFIIIILVVYFCVVLPLMKMLHRLLPTRTCPMCLSFDVPCAASVCKVCGSDIPVIDLRKGRSGKSLGGSPVQSRAGSGLGVVGTGSDEDEEIFHDLEVGTVNPIAWDGDKTS